MNILRDTLVNTLNVWGITRTCNAFFFIVFNALGFFIVLLRDRVFHGILPITYVLIVCLLKVLFVFQKSGWKFLGKL